MSDSRNENVTRAKATANEKMFDAFLKETCGLPFVRPPAFADSGNSVSISVDGVIEADGITVLIEVDSNNYAKLLVGQYVLLNKLCPIDRRKVVFLIVHWYKRSNGKYFNTERTIRNLSYINREAFGDDGLRFYAMTKPEFENLALECQNKSLLVKRIAALAQLK